MGGLQLNIVQTHKAAILKATLLTIVRLLPTATKDMRMKFETEIPNKLELHCRNHAIQKPKYLIWPPGSHLENEVTENQ